MEELLNSLIEAINDLNNRFKGIEGNICNGMTKIKRFYCIKDEIDAIQKLQEVLYKEWYIEGVKSFERDFVRPTENKAEGWEQWDQNSVKNEHCPPNLLMNYVEIVKFSEYSQVGTYKKIEELFNRMHQATEKTEHATLWEKRLQDAQKTFYVSRL